ncbi:leucine-rich repeat domain-containing protein [Pseudoalteromonas umbrosa]|uniref:leucine-rich repeat domain-containing protein n=1 Tax=Pseudoalteromonas umbrosa TaxID=3048489 RepID=UPI0024C47143|nr:hypothetical protein [Pseudoalteromonas sp. B95]MDK1286294.1 hypothetical protein [Pseudoalteromonas sp. B95]
MNSAVSKICLAGLIGIISGCGGGSSDKQEESITQPVVANTVPVVSIEGQTHSDEMQAISLIANGHDKESQLLNYTWSHDGGSAIVLVGENNASITARTNDLVKDTPITFSVTVSDEQGATATATHLVTFIDTPVLTIETKEHAIEQSSFSVKAGVATSKEITSYEWASNAPDYIEVTGTDTDTLIISSGDINEDIPITFNLTVTDETGGEATSSTSVVIKAFAQQLKISGKVTDQPIENANVKAQIGDKVFTAVADSFGEYTLAINLEQGEEAYANELVKLSATGQDKQSFVEFVSQLGSLSQLSLAAGDDEELNVEEQFGVNVTNVTTAEYALLSSFDDAFNSGELLEQRKLGVSAKDKLDIATLLKAIVDNDTVDLPDGYATTLELVKDENAATQYLAQLKEEQPELIERTIDALKSDTDLFQPAEIILDEVLWVTEPDFQYGIYFGLELNDDNTGYYISDERHKVSWERENNRVVVTFLEPVTLNYNAYMDEYHFLELNRIELDFYAQNTNFNSASVTFIGDAHVDSKLQTRQFSFHSQTYTKSSFAQLSQPTLEGTWSLHKIINARENVYFEYEFDENGIATNIQSSEQSKWQISGNELTFQQGKRTQILQLIAHNEFGYHFMGHTVEDDQIIQSYNTYMVKHQDVSFDTFDYQRTWVRLKDIHNSVFRIDEQGLVHFGFNTGRQYSLESGKLVSYRYSFDGNGRYKACENSELCVVSTEYSYQLLAVSGDTIAVNSTLKLIDQNYTFEMIKFIEVKDEHELLFSFDDELSANNIRLYGDNGSIITSVDYCYEDKPCEISLRLISQEVSDFYSFEQRQGYYELTSPYDNSKLYLEVTDLGDNSFAICLKSELSAVCDESNTTVYSTTPVTYPITVKTNGAGRIDFNAENVLLGESIGLRVLADEGHYITALNICGRDFSTDLESIQTEFSYIVNEYDACEIEATFEEKLPVYGKHLLYDPSLYFPLLHELNVHPNGEGVYTYNESADYSPEIKFFWHNLSEYHTRAEFEYVFSVNFTSYYADVFTNDDFYTFINALEFSYLDGNSLVWALDADESDDGLGFEVGPVIHKSFAGEEVQELTDWVGKWVFVYQNSYTYYEIEISADGQAVLETVSEQGFQTSPVQLSWEVDELGQLKLTALDNALDTYILKPVNQHNGFIQIETQDSNLFDGMRYFQKGIGIMAKAMNEPLSIEKLTGQWRFKWGPESNVYHGFVIHEDASVNKYAQFGDVQLDENAFEVRYYLDYSPECETDPTFCIIDQSERFKVLSKNNGLVLLAKGNGEYHIAEHSSNMHVEQFIPSALNRFSFYHLNGERYVTGDIYYRYFDEDKNNWEISTVFDETIGTAKFIDGKFFQQTPQGAYWIAPVMHIPNGIKVCVYQDGQSCEQGIEQTWFYQIPSFDITLDVSQGGAVNTNSSLENVPFYHDTHMTLLADEGYRIADFEGCNARFAWENSISEIGIVLPSLVSDCTLKVSFEQDNGQSILESLGIEDSTFKACLESQGNIFPQYSNNLSCYSYSEDNIQIDNLNGIEKFKFLTSMSFYNISLSGQAIADLESLTQLESLDFTGVDFSHLDLGGLNTLKSLRLSYGSTVTSMELPTHSSLEQLQIEGALFTELDLSNQVSLLSLSLRSSDLTHLDLSSNVELRTLDIESSKIESISGVTTAHKIQSIYAESSALMALDLRNLNEIQNVSVRQTQITKLELGGNPLLTSLDASYSPLVSLNIEPDTYALSYLTLNNTNIEALDLSYFEHLYSLEVTSTPLTSLNLESNQNLFSLQAAEAKLTEVKLENLTNLYTLNLEGNPLAKFEFDENMTSLIDLNLSNTDVTELHIPQGSNLQFLNFSNNTLDNITGVEYISTKQTSFWLSGTTISDELLQYIQSNNVQVYQ